MITNSTGLEQTSMTENMITEVTIEALQTNQEGITQYPILEFDENALDLLKHSTLKPAGSAAYRAVKRILDVVLSALGILFLLIPGLIVAAVIYIEDKGNPIFSQVRLTENGTPFRMYKFRSMCMDAEKRFEEVQKKNECDGIAFKSKHDPRITRIGGFIRKTSIDELPQLFNVLKGDMSLIGPRPPLPREVVLYTPAQMERLMVKGGLSCICQCEGRSDMAFDEWVESDVRYIRTRSLGLDCKLFFSTIAVVLKRKGAR